MERIQLSYNTHRDYNPNWGRYIDSDPIGLNGGLNTYGYVEGNSLSNWDYWGYSKSDIKNITTYFNQSVQQMIKEHIRLPGNGADTLNMNNFIAKACNPNITNSGFYPFIYTKMFRNECTPEKQTVEYCDGQSTYLSKVLYKHSLEFDDNWKFVSQNNGTHWWLVGLSSNKKDPLVYLDPWAEQISIDKPCEHCTGHLWHNASPLDARPPSRSEFKLH